MAAQRLADPTAASSEWDAEFRADLVGYLDDTVIDRAINRARPLELPPLGHGAFYRAFVDPSGGAVGGDAYSIAIAHKEDNKYVVDVVRGRRGPFDPAELTREYAALCLDYKVQTVVGDAYAAQWVTKAWQECGISYVHSDLNASQLYLECLPLFTRGLLELPDHPTLIRELRLLERIPGRVGKDQVTHPRGCHDDHANAVCGCLRTIASYLVHDPEMSWVSGPDTDPAEEARQWQHARLHSYVQSFMAAATSPIITSSGRRLR
jgi:hypothetical protein